jgi:hypothetical protein
VFTFVSTVYLCLCNVVNTAQLGSTVSVCGQSTETIPGQIASFFVDAKVSGLLRSKYTSPPPEFLTSFAMCDVSIGALLSY